MSRPIFPIKIRLVNGYGSELYILDFRLDDGWWTGNGDYNGWKHDSFFNGRDLNEQTKACIPIEVRPAAQRSQFRLS